MANITIKNIPDRIYERIKDSAKLNRRSINNEIIHIMEQQFNATQVNSEEILYKARELRSRMKGSLSHEEVERAIQEGRE